MSLGQLRGWMGIIFILAAMLIKIKKEEEFMNEVFGTSFQSYKMKVKKLIPGIY
jgi:protein-S-isoprenylcysteine O-methyltransferase Ste14